MSDRNRKRLQEGALSALKTPENPPAPSRLVPAQPSRTTDLEGDPSGSPESQAEALGTASSGTSENSQFVQHAVGLLKEGDLEALHMLYVRFAPDVQRYVDSMVHDHGEAEDITKNVFADLRRAIGKYEPRQAPFAAWIMRAARNAALDYLRAKRAIPTEEAPIASPEYVEIGLESNRALGEVLQQLPDDQREVLILRHIAGLTPMEIADTLGEAESSISRAQSRGRLALREVLQQDTRILEELLQE